MRKVFLTLNYLALVAGVTVWIYVVLFTSLDGRMRVVELDRSGVFNADKLREYWPWLAEHLRNNVADWIQEPTLSAAILCAQCIVGLALLNIVGYHLLSTRRSNSQQTAGGNAASPRASV